MKHVHTRLFIVDTLFVVWGKKHMDTIFLINAHIINFIFCLGTRSYLDHSVVLSCYFLVNIMSSNYYNNGYRLDVYTISVQSFLMGICEDVYTISVHSYLMGKL